MSLRDTVNHEKSLYTSRTTGAREQRAQKKRNTPTPTNSVFGERDKGTEIIEIIAKNNPRHG
jgi:hypothetical protein